MKLTLLFALFASTATLAYAAFAPSEWTLEKPIVSSSVSGYVRVILDDEVYKGSANGRLADLRVVSSVGQETPYQLVSLDSSVRNEYYPSTLLDLSAKDGDTMFIIDLGKEGLVHDNLNIVMSGKDYKYQVSVYASATILPHESGAWRTLTEGGYIYNFFDARAGFDAGSGEVSYPKSTARYLRVVMHKEHGAATRVMSVGVHSLLKTAAGEDTHSFAATVSQNAKEQSTEIVADLGASGIPTHRLVLSIGGAHQDLNFDRRVIVGGSDDGLNWRTLGEGYVSQLHTALFSGAQLAIEYPESNTRYIRAIVFNEDNTPIPFNTSIGLVGVMRAIVFDANAGESYTLYYGNSHVAAPRYDITRFFQYIESENMPTLSFGREVPNSAYVAPAPPKQPSTNTYPKLLNIVLVLLVVVVTGILVLYVRKLKLAGTETPKE